jgi:hypothetical protein
MLQQLPNHINVDSTALGRGRQKLDGNLNITALRMNVAIGDRFSLIAAKAGYVDFDPDDTLDGGNGWLDLGIGAKYAFILDPDDEFVLSGKVLFEFSNGSRDALQGNGDGNVAPSLTFLKGVDNFQFMGTIGGILPFNHNGESTLLYSSWHASYSILEEFFPLIEVNYFRVIRRGGRNQSGNLDQPLSLLPKNVTNVRTRFEGGDAINLGSSKSLSHRNFVTLALGMRWRTFKRMDWGFAWETPLTKQQNSLMQNRYTIDVVFHF